MKGEMVRDEREREGVKGGHNLQVLSLSVDSQNLPLYCRRSQWYKMDPFCWLSAYGEFYSDRS